MKKFKKLSVLLALILVLAFSGAVTAYAGSSYESFDHVMRKLQVNTNLGLSETKTYSNVSGMIKVINIGQDYTAKFKMCKWTSGGWIEAGSYTPTLTDGGTGTMGGPFTAGTVVTLLGAPQPMSLVDISCSGKWASF